MKVSKSCKQYYFLHRNVGTWNGLKGGGDNGRVCTSYEKNLPILDTVTGPYEVSSGSVSYN